MFWDFLDIRCREKRASTSWPHQFNSEDHLVVPGTDVDHHAAVRRMLVAEDRMNRPVVGRRMGCIRPAGSRILLVDRTAGAGALRMLAGRTDLPAAGLAEERMMVYRRVTADHSLCVADPVALGKNVGGYVDSAPTGCMMGLMSSLGRTMWTVGKRPGVRLRCRSRWSHGSSNRSSVPAVVIVSHSFLGHTASYSR
jgi:hypothetical protein